MRIRNVMLAAALGVMSFAGQMSPASAGVLCSYEMTVYGVNGNPVGGGGATGSGVMYYCGDEPVFQFNIEFDSWVIVCDLGIDLFDLKVTYLGYPTGIGAHSMKVIAPAPVGDVTTTAGVTLSSDLGWYDPIPMGGVVPAGHAVIEHDIPCSQGAPSSVRITGLMYVWLGGLG